MNIVKLKSCIFLYLLFSVLKIFNSQPTVVNIADAATESTLKKGVVTTAPSEIASAVTTTQESIKKSTPTILTTDTTKQIASTTTVPLTEMSKVTKQTEQPIQALTPSTQTVTTTTTLAKPTTEIKETKTSIALPLHVPASTTAAISQENEKAKILSEVTKKNELLKLKLEEEDKQKKELEISAEKKKEEKKIEEEIKNKEKEKLEQELKVKEKDNAAKLEKAKIKVPKELKVEQNKEKVIISTLDTLTAEDQGNWLLKRVWWEQAENTFEKIIEVNDQIVKLQSTYFNKNRDIDKKLSSSFRKLGYEQGELEEVLSYLLNEIQKDRPSNDLNLQERDFLKALTEKKKNLDELKVDLDTLANYDQLIEDALEQLIKQINLSRDYEKKSWDNFKEIGRVLNDKIAKVLFYEIDANLKNVQNILTYIKNDLNKYFEGLLNKTESLSNEISEKINKLQKDGLSLKDQIAMLKKFEEEREAQKKKIELEKIKETKKGWFSWLYAPIDWIKSFFKK